MKQEVKDQSTREELFSKEPWTFYEKYEGENAVTIKSGEHHICDIVGANFEEGVPSKLKVRANATLISQAPAMYRALKKCLDDYETHWDAEDENSSTFMMIGLLKSILQKATPNK